MTTVRRLAADEASLWQQLSLEAIANHPEAFVTSHDEERALPLDHFANRIEQGTQVFVADDNSGMGFLCVAGEQASIHGIYVRPVVRGAGVADALMGALLAAAQETGCRSVSLEVFADNCPALRLYERHGFAVQSSTKFRDRDSLTMITSLA